MIGKQVPFLALVVLLALPVLWSSLPGAAAQGQMYYVRTDGGSAEASTGLADAPYSGSGTNRPCAWDHPFRALPPDGTPRIAGGDTLIIGAGSYRMGYGAPGADNCYAEGAYGCHMPPIPGGPDLAHRTRILGAGWNAGCASPPELWGAERPWFIVNLTDASNVELACLEITDHSGCVEFHSGGLACERDTPPYGDWASYGLYAEDSANVYLHDLNVHGLAAGGVHAGRLTDWTVEDVRVAGNGSVGWDGDLWDEFGDSNSGMLAFRHWTVEWNGCGETFPGEQPTGCCAQTAGGYGDGVPAGDWRAIDPYHTYMASFRAVENGFSLVRVVRNGFSAAFDYQGRVLGSMDYFTTQDRLMLAHVPIKGVPTIYAQIGDAFAWLNIAGFVVLLGWLVVRHFRKA